LLAEDRWLK
jgi:hypothetical protein